MEDTMFPLRLTCLEEYMFRDDRPAYPMTGIFRLRFSGRLDRPAFEAALTDSVRRHPLLQATVEVRRGRTPRWIAHPDWQPTIQWDAATNRFGYAPAEFQDLAQAPGIRVWGIAGLDGDEVMFQIHHSCTDALGLNAVIDDLLLGYAVRTDEHGGTMNLPEIDMQRFLCRGAPDLTAWRLLKMSRQQARGLLGAREFLMRSPAPLTGSTDAVDMTAPPPEYPCALTCGLSAEETAGLLAAAKSRQVTVNDLLLRDLFLAAGAWRSRRQFGGEQDWLRFSVPMNLRSPADARAPMANSVSSVFIDRRAADFEDADKLLAGIHAQMSLIKRLQLQYTFLLSLGVARWLPGGISKGTQADRCRLTCWMSNLGTVFPQSPLPRVDGRLKAGNVVLESVDYVIPLRPLMHAGILVHTYAGRLRVLLSIDPRAVSDEAGQQLLDMYIERIRRTIVASVSDGP
jgi:NRPS condensation-like uncharacterized protein